MSKSNIYSDNHLNIKLRTSDNSPLYAQTFILLLRPLENIWECGPPDFPHLNPTV